MQIPFINKKNPKQMTTGTTYTSKGAPLSAADYTEQGSAARSNLFETVPELVSRTQAQQAYTKMYRNSVSVRIGIRAAEAPVAGADYYIDPFSSDPQDLLIAEFVAYNLFGVPTVPFKRTVRQICNGMYKSGSKVMSQVWALQEWSPQITASAANRKQYTILKKLAPRPTETIDSIQYDANGGPLSVTQNAINPVDGSTSTVVLDIQNVIIFPFEEEDGDLLGNSILRPAFSHYTYLDGLFKIDAIQKERHGIGIPDIKLHAGYTDADKKLAHVIGRNLRTNDRAYVVSNDRFDVTFLKPEGQMVNALESADYHDTMILKSLMLQWLNMGIGESGGGGRATSATALDAFLKSMRYVGESICDGFNNYCIPQIVGYNFNTTNYPQLKVRNIGETKDLQMWSSAMANLVGKGAIEVDEPTEDFIRAQVDFPKRTTPRSKIVTTNVEDIYNENPDGTTTPGKTAGTPPTPTAPANPSGGTGGGKVQSGNVGKSPSSGAV